MTLKFTVFILLLDIIACISAENDYGKILLANVFFRHGDRTPLETYPNDPYNAVDTYWPEGLGQLTEVGNEQQYALGQYLRRRYTDLLPEVYSHKDLYVKSEDGDRCVMSAECSLFAMYPPLNNTSSGKNIVFQPIPIHTVPASQDPIYNAWAICDRYLKGYELLKQSSVYKCIDNVTQNVRDAVKEYAGSTEFNAGIYDILLIEDLHNMSLPNWTAKYYPEPLQVINQFYWYLGVAGTKELQKMAIGSFINEMVGNMVAKKNGTLSPDRKMFLYPGHDYTISDTFLALDIYDGVRVPYASFASIELRLKDNSHYVLITYSNSTTQEPYIMKLPNCDELCPFDTFLKIVQPMLVTDFSSECATAPGSQEDWAIPIQNLPEEWKVCFASSTKTTPNQKPDNGT